MVKNNSLLKYINGNSYAFKLSHKINLYVFK